ncbi:MAG: ATP-binding protein [Nanoarchaeota archaeon]|nr:ATP-binding protein [Nanoarchaeota archaeon]
MSDILIEEIDVTPSKEILESIASDIDLKKGLLEFIDNSIDAFFVGDRTIPLIINMELDSSNQKVIYKDNAGGIKEENLNLIIKLGGTTRSSDDLSIGEFGVGMKRAIVALSKKAEVTSKFESKETFKLKIDDSWRNSPIWKIPKYKTEDLSEPGTQIILNELKYPISLATIQEIKKMISETYCFLLGDKVKLFINTEELSSVFFNKWAFPPDGRHPRTYKTFITIDNQKVGVEITTGLMLESSQTGEYGADIYCNNRLILKNCKAPQLGFRSGLLGNPHPTIAWFKSIIKISGANKYMPWNSTKSNLDLSNQIIPQLIDKFIKLSKPYVQLSRRLYSSARTEIFPFSEGDIEVVDLTKNEEIQLTPQYIPSLPPGKRTQAEVILNENKEIIQARPWTRGLIENVYLADLVQNKTILENKNRFVLILLDSCLEISFKDYLFYIKRISISKEDKESIKYRDTLHKLVQKNSNLVTDIWPIIDYFYKLRCSLYHETSSPEITETDIENFRELISTILNELHGVII